MTEWITSNFWSKVNMWFNNLRVVIFMHIYMSTAYIYSCICYSCISMQVFLNLRNHLTVCAFDLRNINHLNLLQIPNNKIALPPKHFIHLSLNKIFWQVGDLYLTKLRWKFTEHDWSKWIVSNAETKLVFDKCPANSQLPTDLRHDKVFQVTILLCGDTSDACHNNSLVFFEHTLCSPLDTLKRCWGGK